MGVDFKKEINLKAFYRNKTFTYLLPIIRDYGDEFVKNFRNLQPVVYTIGDMAHDPRYLDNDYFYITCTMNSSFVYNQHVFSSEVYDKFRKFIEVIKGYPSYVTEYVQGDPKDNNYTVVLRLPQDYQTVKHKFYEGKYSEMYSRETISRIIPKYVTSVDGIEMLTKSYSVLSKDSRYIPVFENQVYRDFGTKLQITADDDREFDYKPQIHQEVLNYSVELDPYLKQNGEI